MRIYACGPTVYGRVHVGNARPFVMFSLLKRFLRHEGYQPVFVGNITDINDKIYAAARQAGVPSADLAEQMTAAYKADTDAFGLGRGKPLTYRAASLVLVLEGLAVIAVLAVVVAGTQLPADLVWWRVTPEALLIAGPL